MESAVAVAVAAAAVAVMVAERGRSGAEVVGEGGEKGMWRPKNCGGKSILFYFISSSLKSLFWLFCLCAKKNCGSFIKRWDLSRRIV